MNDNPYNISSPVTGPRLFGRAAFLTDVLQAIGDSQAVLIFGPPKFGKSSVLQQVAAQLAGQEYTAVYVALKNSAQLPAEELLQRLGRTIAETAQLAAPTVESPQELAGFLRQVQQKISPQQLALLLDDVDTLTPAQAQALAAALQPGDDSPAVVLSTGTPLPNLPPAFEPITRLAQYKELPPLTPQATFDLLTHPQGISYAPLALENLSHLAAGHPYFVQLLGHQTVEQAHQQQHAQIDVETINAALPSVLEKATPVLAPLAAGLSTIELNVLSAAAVVAGQEKFVTPKFVGDQLRKRKIAISESDIDRSLDTLQQRGLLRRDMQGVFSFIIPLAARWATYKFPLPTGAAGLPKWQLLAATAAAVIVLGAGWLLWQNFSGDSSPPPPPVAADSPTAQAAAAGESTEEPTPAPTPTPSPLPTDTPTMPPTFTPLPTDTPSPTPTQTATPLPTNTPTEEPTQAPTPTPTPVALAASPTPAPAAAPLPQGLQFLDVAVAGSGPSIEVFAVAKDEGIYRRSAGGWSLFSEGVGDDDEIRSVGVRSNGGAATVYAGYNDGVRRWDPAAGWSGKSAFPRFHDFVAIPNSAVVFAGSDKGVYRSIDDGRTWEAINLGLGGRIIEVAIFSLALGQNSAGTWTLYAAGADTALILKTTVDPAREASQSAQEPRWEDVICQCQARDALFAIAADPANAQNLYVGTDRSRISFSTDGGATWSTTVVPVGQAQEVFITDIAVAPGNTVVYAATGSDPAAYASNGILISSNPGNWSAVRPPRFIAGRDYVASIALDPANPQMLYVGGSNGLFRFDNSTQSWIPSP